MTNGYITDIEAAALQNENFRQVLFTTKQSQLVLMSLQPGEDIGEEIHDVDQFLRIEAGSGRAVLNGVAHEVKDGSAIMVPAGARHNIVNTGAAPLKLYTLYAPPDHRGGTVHPTKADAAADTDDHFAG